MRKPEMKIKPDWHEVGMVALVGATIVAMTIATTAPVEHKPNFQLVHGDINASQDNYVTVMRTPRACLGDNGSIAVEGAHVFISCDGFIFEQEIP